jgi:glycerol uptake facilitator-like aquaporin
MQMTRWFASLLFFMMVADAAAQQLPRQPAPDLPNPSAGGNIGLAQFFSSRTPYEFWLTCIIIAFGLVVIVLLLWHFRSVPDRRTEDVARAVIVVTVIVGTLILVTAGYSNDQIAPAFGLFGTIVGYMLGRLSPRSPEQNPDQGTPDKPGPA